MPDTLAVAQVICHEVIRELMAEDAGPLRSRTKVSLSSRRRLLRLRRRLRNAQAGFSRQLAVAVTNLVIDELVKEVRNFFRETSIYNQSPLAGHGVTWMQYCARSSELDDDLKQKVAA